MDAQKTRAVYKKRYIPGGIMKHIWVFLLLISSFSYASDQNDETAKRLFEVLKMDKLLESKAIAYKEQMETLLSSSDISEEELLETKKMYGAVIDEVINFLCSQEVLLAFEQSYSETFSKEELEDLIVFYSSPTGKKFLNKSGLLNKAFMAKIAPQFTTILSKLETVNSNGT